jgi:autotransporter-associated beta strand protein
MSKFFMKVQSNQPMLKQRLQLWILPLALSLGLFSANVSQAQSTITNAWIGTTSTNAASNINYTTNGTTGNAATNLFAVTNTFVYSNSYSQATVQTFDFGRTNAIVSGVSIRSYSNNVVFTNVGQYRLDSGGITATNGSGLSGKAAGIFYIWNTNVSQLANSTTTIQGNMGIFIQNLSEHSSSARTVTQNAGSLCISNLGVTMANSSNGLSSAILTWSGTGTTTVIGSLFQSRLSSGGTNVTAAMTVQSGTLNLATTNTNNVSTSSVTYDGNNNFGWNSGLIITNSGSVFVNGQNSMGIQNTNVRIGTTNNGTTTFGLFGSNDWATNTATIVTLTNNFDINNSGAGTNIFRGITGKSLILSGVLTNANTNGTLIFRDGVITLSGSNTALSLPIVVTNAGTLVAANNNALGSRGVTIASGATLTVNATIANSVTNNGGVAIADGGSLVSGNGYSGSGSLSVGAAASNNPASFTSSSRSGTNNIGPLSLTGNATLGLDVLTQISSTGAVAITSTNNLITVTGTASLGTYNLVVGNSLIGASLSSIALNGSAVGSPSAPIPLGKSITNNGTIYTFTNSSTTLQLVVDGDGPQDLTFADTDGLWNTNSANTVWKPVLGGASAAFRTGDSTAFTNSATVTVDNAGVTPNIVSFNNPSSTSVDISGGPITATIVTAGGQGSVNVFSDLIASNGITVNSGNVTLAKTTVISGDITVVGGSLTNSAETTITAGGLNVGGGGALAVSGSISAGAVNVSNGAVSGSGSITGSSYSVANATYDVNLTGSNSLTVSGTSSLGGANSGFSGPVSVAGGNLSLASLSSLGTGALTLSGGSILTLSNGTLVNSIALGVGGGGVFNSGDLTISGAVTNATGQVNQPLIKNGPGQLNLPSALGASGASVALNVNNGNLVLSGATKFATNATINTGSKMVLDNVTMVTGGNNLFGAGGGTIEVTNTSVWSNSINNLTNSAAVLVGSGSRLILSNGNVAYRMVFGSGITGPGSLTVSGSATGANDIRLQNVVSTLTNVTIDPGLKLMLSNVTASNTVFTNNGTLDINISSTITNITGQTSGVTTYRGDISGNGNISVSSSQNIFLAGNISGSNNVSLAGGSSGSQVFLTGSNSFSGGINFANADARALWYGNSNALGSGTISNNTSTNAQLGYSGSANTADYTFGNAIYTGTTNTAILSFKPGVSNNVRLGGVISGLGNLKISGSQDGILYLNNSNNTYSGGTEIGTGDIAVGSDGALGASNGAVNFGTGTNSWLVVTSNVSFHASRNFTMSSADYTANIDTGANDVTINGGLIGTGGGNLNKVGTGSLTLAGTPNYTGTTTLAAGTLNLGGNAITNTALKITTGTLTNGSIQVGANSTGITVSGNSTNSANLSGAADFTLGSVTNITVRLSGSNSFSGLITLGATNNQTLEVTGVNALSQAANLQGGSALLRVPTLSLLSGGAYKMNRYKDGNFLFSGTNASTTSLTFTNSSGNTMSGGDKVITASNVVVNFDGDIDLAPNKAQKKMAFAGNGDFNLRGVISSSAVSPSSGGILMESSGTMTLSATNTYNDATSVTKGTLIVADTGALPTNATVSVTSGAKLKFNQSSGGISVGAMTVAGTLEQNLITITSSDAVDLTESTLTVNGEPSLASYTLVTGTSLTGTPNLSSPKPNYKLTNSPTSLLLVKKETPVLVVTPETYTYNGSIQGPGTGQVSTESTGVITLRYTGTTSSGAPYDSDIPPTLPGDYSVTATTAEDPNYTDGTSSATAFTIAKAGSTITATGETSFTYSGSPQGPGTSNVTGSTGEVTYSYSGSGYGPTATKPTDVGSYTMTATVGADANYNTASSSAYGFTIVDSGMTYAKWLENANALPTNTNFWEYVYGALAPGGSIVKPTVEVTGGNLVLTYYVREGASGLDVKVKTSSSLATASSSWSEITDPIYKYKDGAPLPESSTRAGVQKWKAKVSTSVFTKQFMKLEATETP